MACKFAVEAMRQTPALWAYFIESEREPDASVREHAAVELAAWLDNETRLYPRLRKAVGDRNEKLREIASAAAAAWVDLQPGEPFWLPNTFVGGFNEKRKKKSLAGRGSSYVDSSPDIEIAQIGDMQSDAIGGDDEGLAEFESREASRQQLNTLSAEAGLSEREAAVIERLRRDMEYAEIAAELEITKGQVAVHWHRATKKLRKAAGL